MPRTIDLFPGFTALTVETDRAELFLRVGGSGPPLVLLHGYPQTHVCWHKIAGQLEEHFTVILCDLPGYGASRFLDHESEHTSYSKRAMAAAVVDAMKQLGVQRFRIVGHDRGARVAYRLALDHPDSLDALAVLSILPTFAMWQRLQDASHAMKTFHWFFLAQPAPLPEMLIEPVAAKYLRTLLASWSGTQNLSVFSPYAIAAYEQAFKDRAVISATCRDYRAGYTEDRLHDQEDVEAGRKISCRTLVLSGSRNFPDESEMQSAWRMFCEHAQFSSLDCGHFLPEEAPDKTAAMLLEFLLDKTGNKTDVA